MADLKAAVLKLDVNNDNHWIADGSPRLDTVKMLASDQTITREALEEAVPGFNRTTAPGYALAGAPATETAPAQDGPAPAAQAETAGGQGVSGSPQPVGAGAAPQSETESAEVSDVGGGDPVTPSSDVETEQSEVEDGDVSAEDEIAALEAELAEGNRHLAEGDKVIDQIRKEMDDIRKRMDDKHDRLSELRKTTNTNAGAIRGYLDRQKQALLERGARQQMIKDSGINFKELARNLKAPIDAVRQRQTGHGNRRK